MRVEWFPPAGEPLRLDDDPRWRLLAVAGHGAPDARLLTAGSPGRDELLALHAAAQPRIVALTLQIHGASLAAYETNRAALATAFAPWSGPGPSTSAGRLEVTLTDGRRRALRAFARAGLGWSLGRQHGASALETIEIEAPDPFWYDPSPVSGDLTIGPPGGLPFNTTTQLAFPAGFGPDTPGLSSDISYAGSVRSFPVFEFAGPVSNPSARLGSIAGQPPRDEAVTFDLVVPAGLTLEVTLGPQPDGSSDAPAAELVDELGVRSNVLGTLRPGSRFWALGPGLNRVVLGQDSPEGNTVRYRYLPREVAI